MFQFRRFPTYAYLIQRTLPKYCFGGFPHSEIPGSMDICSSPRLIAACHVLHRLLMPRHSPCALYSLTLRTILSDGSHSELCRLPRDSFSAWLIVFTLHLSVLFHNYSCSLRLSPKDLSVALLFSSSSSFVQFSRCDSVSTASRYVHGLAC